MRAVIETLTMVTKWDDRKIATKVRVEIFPIEVCFFEPKEKTKSEFLLSKMRLARARLLYPDGHSLRITS